MLCFTMFRESREPSTNTTLRAPRLRASMPIPPAPAKRSRKTASTAFSPRMLNRACLTLSDVGLTRDPAGTFKRRPLPMPPVTLSGAPLRRPACPACGDLSGLYNATSRGCALAPAGSFKPRASKRFPPPAGAGGFQVAGYHAITCTMLQKNPRSVKHFLTVLAIAYILFLFKETCICGRNHY